MRYARTVGFNNSIVLLGSLVWRAYAMRPYNGFHLFDSVIRKPCLGGVCDTPVQWDSFIRYAFRFEFTNPVGVTYL